MERTRTDRHTDTHTRARTDAARTTHALPAYNSAVLCYNRIQTATTETEQTAMQDSTMYSLTQSMKYNQT